MLEFLKNWRRNAGCALLVMACGLMIDCLVQRVRFEELMAHLAKIPDDEIVERVDDGQNIHIIFRNFHTLPSGKSSQDIHIDRFDFLWQLFIVVPLAILSACLMLPKPQTKAKVSDQPPNSNSN